MAALTALPSPPGLVFTCHAARVDDSGFFCPAFGALYVSHVFVFGNVGGVIGIVLGCWQPVVTQAANNNNTANVMFFIGGFNS